jgi:hypothetical protein
MFDPAWFMPLLRSWSRLWSGLTIAMLLLTELGNLCEEKCVQGAEQAPRTPNASHSSVAALPRPRHKPPFPPWPPVPLHGYGLGASAKLAHQAEDAFPDLEEIFASFGESRFRQQLLRRDGLQAGL